MTGLLESAVRKLSFVWPTTEVSPHSAGYEGVPRVWPFNATEKLDPDVRELLSMHCSWCVLDCDQAQGFKGDRNDRQEEDAIPRRSSQAHAPVPGSSQLERDANHCVAELRSATVMLGISGAENMSNSGYELARKRSSNEEASHHRPDRLRRDHPDECYRQCLHPLHL